MKTAFYIACGALLVLSAVAVSLTTSTPAEARCCGCTWASNSNHQETRSQVNLWITELERAVVTAIRESTKQISNYHNKQIEADKRVADAEQQNASLRLRHEFRAKAESEGRYDPDPTGCLVVERAGYPRPGNAPEADAPTLADGARSERLETAARREGGSAYAAEHIQMRAAIEQTGRSTTDWAAVLSEGTLTDPVVKEAEATATAARVQNVIDPAPPPELTPEDRGAPRGAAADQNRDGYRARMSLAREAFAHALALREGQFSGGVAIRPVGVYRKLAAKSLHPRPISGSDASALSELEALRVATLFHHEPGAAEALARKDGSMTERNLLERVYEVAALNARISYLRFEQENLRLMLDAAAFAIAVPRPERLTASQ